MQKKINWRNKLHVEKSVEEREAYKRFLQAASPDETADKPLDIDKTNASSYETEKLSENNKVTKKSIWLKLKDGDIFKNEIIIGIIVVIAGATVWGYLVLWSDLKAQNIKIDDLRRDIDQTIEKYEISSDKINTLDKEFNISKAEILKDLVFLKDKLLNSN